MQSSSQTPAKSKAPTWPSASHTTIFLRNLRLLQLDKHHDWPDITEQTFHPSQQNTRRRIQAVEWSLYYLFQLWDPAETQNKLRPHFPPLEPLQSVNLRAALFRALSDLKKNGFLGREAALRKTMLDECKGEKFEEAIAAFSTAVLRRCLVSQEHDFRDIATRISTSTRPTIAEQEALLPLILAHRASLAGFLEERKRLNDSHDTNDSFIRSTLDQLSRRSKDIPTTREGVLSEFSKARRDLIDAWAGSSSWANTILEGGNHVTTEPLLEMEFPQAWSVIRKGEALMDQPPAGSTDLLADLDTRIEQQKARLQKWKEFRKSLAAERRVSTTADNRPKSTTPLLFREHQELSVTTSKQPERGSDELPQREEYGVLLSDMKDALDNSRGSLIPHGEQQYPVITTTDTTPPADFQSNVQIADDGRGPAGRGSGGVPRHSPALSGDKDDKPTFSTRTENTTEVSMPRHNSDRSNTPSILIEADRAGDSEVTNASLERGPALQDQTPETRDAATSLTERTRKSMSLLPDRRSSGSRHTRAKRPRESFPVKPFETPQQPDSGQRSGARTPQEDLFSQDADYASVFKSRPKIAMSPVNSPTPHTSPFADEENEEDTYQWSDNHPTSILESSPSVQRQNRRT